jgi:hypothetical protein
MGQLLPDRPLDLVLQVREAMARAQSEMAHHESQEVTGCRMAKME